MHFEPIFINLQCICGVSRIDQFSHWPDDGRRVCHIARWKPGNRSGNVDRNTKIAIAGGCASRGETVVPDLSYDLYRRSKAWLTRAAVTASSKGERSSCWGRAVLHFGAGVHLTSPDATRRQACEQHPSSAGAACTFTVGFLRRNTHLSSGARSLSVINLR